MSTPKKKHLIELMIEYGGKWPDGAEYAAQDKGDKTLHFYSNGKPNLPPGTEFWMAHNCDHDMDETIRLELVCRNWHQTIVTREQYEKALAESHQVHFPTRQPETFMCRCAAAPVASTIEQLTADYHAKAAEADRLQAVADEALKAADDALLALEKAGELIGLIISIDTKPKLSEQQTEPEQPEITDWRDLRVGDVVEHVEHNGGRARIGSRGVVSGAFDQCIAVDYPEHGGYVYSVPECQHKFRFISRP